MDNGKENESYYNEGYIDEDEVDGEVILGNAHTFRGELAPLHLLRLIVVILGYMGVILSLGFRVMWGLHPDNEQ